MYYPYSGSGSVHEIVKHRKTVSAPQIHDYNSDPMPVHNSGELYNQNIVLYKMRIFSTKKQLQQLNHKQKRIKHRNDEQKKHNSVRHNQP